MVLAQLATAVHLLLLPLFLCRFVGMQLCSLSP